MIDFSTPLQGLQTAQSQFNRTAQRVAQNPAEASDPNNAVDIIQAQNQYTANLDTIQVGNELTQTTLNLLA